MRSTQLYMRKKLLAELLFQVRNDCAYHFNGGECFDVMRICGDLQIMDDFHNLQLVVIPKKAICKPKFFVIDQTPKPQDNVYNSSANASVSEGSRECAIAKPPIKRNQFRE